MFSDIIGDNSCRIRFVCIFVTRDSVASRIAETLRSDARWRPGYKPRHFILSDAAARLSRLAMADVAMVTSWKEFWSWTERAVRQETSLEAFASLVGPLRSPNPLFWVFFSCHFEWTLQPVLSVWKQLKAVLDVLTVCSGFQSKRVSLLWANTARSLRSFLWDRVHSKWVWSTLKTQTVAWQFVSCPHNVSCFCVSVCDNILRVLSRH